MVIDEVCYFVKAVALLFGESCYNIAPVPPRVPARLAVAVLIASLFVLIFELQYPLRSNLGVSPETWSGLIRHIEDMDRTNGPMTMRM